MLEAEERVRGEDAMGSDPAAPEEADLYFRESSGQILTSSEIP